MAQGRGVVPAWRAEGPPHGRRGRLGEHGVRGKGEFHAEVFLAEHAEGAEGWVSRRGVSRRARRGRRGLGFSQRCFSQSTQRAQRVGFLAEHAEAQRIGFHAEARRAQRWTG